MHMHVPTACCAAAVDKLPQRPSQSSHKAGPQVGGWLSNGSAVSLNIKLQYVTRPSDRVTTEALDSRESPSQRRLHANHARHVTQRNARRGSTVPTLPLPLCLGFARLVTKIPMSQPLTYIGSVTVASVRTVGAAPANMLKLQHSFVPSAATVN